MLISRNFLAYSLFFVVLGIHNYLGAQPSNLQKSATSTENVYVKFNRIQLPIFEQGLIARNYHSYGARGIVDSKVFLKSSGFILTGINNDGELWTNASLGSYGQVDYLPGKSNDSSGIQTRFYISKDSEPFGADWIAWSEAVAQGAEFYDGNSDGLYDPIDFNENKFWDPTEDKPAIYGDVTVWSIFHDGMPQEYRRFGETKSQGIEIRQTIWGFNSVPNLEKVYFIKYSIRNNGDVSDSHDSVYFAINSDADIGYSRDDLIGSFPISNSAYIYQPGNDIYLLNDDISFMVSLLQGPVFDTYEPSDIAYTLEGMNLSNNSESGKLNRAISSVTNIYSSSFLSSHEGLRSAVIRGDNNDPCIDNYGSIYDTDCGTVDSKYLYSGDPFKSSGWINTNTSDKSLVMSTGPFKLVKDVPTDIIFSFVVGNGENGLDALKDAISIQGEINNFYYDDPEPLPRLDPIVITDENSIELVWETAEFFNYHSSGLGFDMEFEGFNVYMYNSASTSEYVNGEINRIKIASYNVQNAINKILINDDKESDTDLIYDGGEQLNVDIYSDYDIGRIILKIARDPFSNKTLEKWRPYYISITPFALNINNIEKYDETGIYIVPHNSNYGYVEEVPEIILDNKGNPGIVIGENENDPFYKGVPLQHVSGNSEVEVTYSVYDRANVTDDLYEIGFTRLESDLYNLSYYVKNLSSNEYLAENIYFNNSFNDIRNLKDGFLINIEWLNPGVQEVSFIGENQWYKELDDLETGVFYLGTDVPRREKITPILPLKFCRAISADKLTDVELNFGVNSKAYRYLRKAVRYLWAGAENPDEGFLDIPVVANKIFNDGSKEQLSIAFVENAFPNDSLTYPDLKWNPAADIRQSKEYLIIFNAPYSDDHKTHLAYIGNSDNPANITHGYRLDSENDSLNSLARSPWFNAMYVVGFEMEEYSEDFSPTGTVLIDANHVLSPSDRYVFKVKKEKTFEENRAQFDKVNVYPNPLFAYNAASNHFGRSHDKPFVTFSHLPEDASIKIYALSGNLIRTLNKSSLTSQVRWDLQNEFGRRVGSGMFLAIVESPGLGQKVLKFAILMPQKQVHF